MAIFDIPMQVWFGQLLLGLINGAFYAMLHRSLTEGAPLEVTPQEVRQQIAVIEECRRQNPQIYPEAGASA